MKYIQVTIGGSHNKYNALVQVQEEINRRYDQEKANGT